MKCLVGCAIVTGVLLQDARPASEIPLRDISVGSAIDGTFGLILSAHELRDGRILVNDPEHRRLMLWDGNLRQLTVVSDSSPGALMPYGDVPAQIIPYRGDSILFVNSVSRTLLLLDPAVKFVRAVALPHAADFRFVANSRTVADAQGRLIYRASFPPPHESFAKPAGTYVKRQPDAAPLVRADFERRTVDTLDALRIPVTESVKQTVRPDGSSSYIATFYPLDWADDWGVTSDGSVVIVRGQEYRADWIDRRGIRSSSAKMPFAWRRIGDDEKHRLADSVRVVMQAIMDTVRMESATRPRRELPLGSVSSGPMIGSFNLREGTSIALPLAAVIVAAEPSDMPDYYPAIRAGAVKTDRDGATWVLPQTTALGDSDRIIYDVVNRNGELFERVKMPTGRSIAGYGPGGQLFLMYRDDAKRWHLETGRVIR
ncbi:MAG TPA: hypothetical protein VE967_14680 [Gemmatimonadaceae bacterium]|nr:hypothetical protein [Gemmatimonadaceae bacterium]